MAIFVSVAGNDRKELYLNTVADKQGPLQYLGKKEYFGVLNSESGRILVFVRRDKGNLQRTVKSHQ